MAMANDWQEMKEITLPKNGDSVVTVVVNGVKYQVEAGKPTMVPYPVYERLTEMIEQDNIPPAKFPGGMVKLDRTLTEEGAAADAKAVGDALASPPSLTWDDLGRGEVETPIWSLTAEFISAGSQSFTNAAIDPAPSGLKVGQTYRVIYDGEKYDVVAKYSRGPYFGALNLQEAYPENLEYPFLIRFGNTVQVLTTTPGMHTLTIATVEEDGIIPIPEEYLPQGAGGGSMEPILINAGVDTLTASIPFEEAWALSVPELAARLCLHNGMPEYSASVMSVQKNNNTTCGRHIVARCDYADALSVGVLISPSYVLWAEGHDPKFMEEVTP